MGKLTGITIDCNDPVRMAIFWAAALDGYMTDAEHKMLTSQSGPPIHFQQVPEPKSVKSRVHLDIISTDPAGDVFRIQRMGGRKVTEMDEGGHKWTVMQDVEGNEFCVVDAS